MSDEGNEPVFDVAACLNEVRRNDQAAARALVEHFYQFVLKIVRGHLPRRMDEDDLAQEIFMKMFSKLGDYRETAPFEHWLSRVALNTCLNQLRGERVRPELRWADLSEQQLAVLDATAESKNDAHPLDAIASNDLVESLLECLSPQDRMIIQMLELDDLSVDEIKRRTGWSGTMIRVRAYRARQKMRKSILSSRKKDLLP